MLNVTEETKNTYLGASDKQLVISFPDANITITNADIVSEEFELYEGIETEERLTFKGCIASQIKFKCADIVRDLRGEYVEVTIQAGETEVIPLFKGYIKSQENQTHEDVLTEFTAYDILHKANEWNINNWLKSLSFPISVKNFRDALFTRLGIQQEVTTLPNDNLMISETLLGYLESPTPVELLRWLCEMNARYGQIGRDGKFHYRKLWVVTEGLYPSSETFPSDLTFPSDENASEIISVNYFDDIEYEPYDTDKITKVSIYDAGGITQGNAGTGTNVWSIVENPIAFNVPMQDEARNLYNEVSQITHTPLVRLHSVARPWLECGDIVMAYTDTNIVRTYVLERRINGIQALFDEIKSDTNKYLGYPRQTAMTAINADRKSILQVQADVLEVAEIQTDFIQSTNAHFQNLISGNIDTGTLKVNRIASNSVGVDKLSGKISKQDYTGASSWEIDLTNGTMKIGDINANHIQAGTITADKIRANEITADKMNVQASGNDGYGNTWSVGFSQYGSSFGVGNLNANKLNGSIGGSGGSSGWGVNFNDKTVKVGNLDASHITSGTIDASRIRADVFRGRTVECYGVECNTITSGSIKANIFLVGSQGLRLITKTISGQTIHYLGY